MQLRSMTAAILLGAALLATPAFAQTAGNKGPAEIPANRDAPFSLPGEATPMPPLKIDSSTLSRGPLALDPAAALASMGTETLNKDGSTESKAASEGLRAILEKEMKGSDTATTDRIVVGPDDRKQITDASEYPSRIVGWLWSQAQDDSWSTCSATLIGPYTVVTAAHCVYVHEKDGWVKQLVFPLGSCEKGESPKAERTNSPRAPSCTPCSAPRQHSWYRAAAWRSPRTRSTAQRSCRAAA